MNIHTHIQPLINHATHGCGSVSIKCGTLGLSCGFIHTFIRRLLYPNVTSSEGFHHNSIKKIFKKMVLNQPPNIPLALLAFSPYLIAASMIYLFAYLDVISLPHLNMFPGEGLVLLISC